MTKTYIARTRFPYRTRHLVAGEQFEADEKLGTLLVKLGRADPSETASQTAGQPAAPAKHGKGKKAAAAPAESSPPPPAPPVAPAAPPVAPAARPVGFMTTSNFAAVVPQNAPAAPPAADTAADTGSADSNGSGDE